MVALEAAQADKAAGPAADAETKAPAAPRRPRPSDAEIVQKVHDRLFWGIRESEDHREAAGDAYLSYFARQRYFPEDPESFHIVVNSTMPDTNRKVAKIMDSDPQIDARGRGAEDFEYADQWDAALRYSRETTGDNHDTWKETLLRVLFQWKLCGEGCTITDFDPDEEDGRGMVFSEWVDSLHVVWGRNRSQQKRNARWVVWFEPIEVEVLEEEYPQLAGQITADAPSLIEGALWGGASQDRDPLMEEDGVDEDRHVAPNEPQKAYRIKMWEKRKLKRVVYEKPDGEIARKRDAEGREVPLTPRQYKALPEEVKKQLTERTLRRQELWETTIINNHVLDYGLSKWDRSKGGHGQYPIAFCSNIWDPRYTHAHGDAVFAQGIETLQSEVATRWVESMFIANAQFLDVVKGAYPKSEESKLDSIGRNPFQKIQRFPGMEPAQFINSNPSGANALAAGSGFLREIQDNITNVHSIHRGGMPYETSGRGLGKLLAEAAIQDNLDRIRVESFLRQETVLRMATMQMAYSDYRLMRITNAGSNEDYALYIGDTEDRTRAHFGIEDEVETFEDDRDPVLTGRQIDKRGREAKILPLKDQDVNRYDIRLVLDSGKERNKAERLELVEMFSEMAARLSDRGLGLVKWAADLLDVPNRDQLMEALAQADEQTQFVQRVEGLLENTGLNLDQIEQMAQAVTAPEEGEPAAPGAAPAGPPLGTPAGASSVEALPI